MQQNDEKRPTHQPVRKPTPGDARREIDYSLFLVPLATAGFFLACIPALLHRAFDPDEFEHAHAAWCVFKGMLPYKDFFEHHTPWYYYVLRPFFHGFDVEHSFESARHFLIFGRGLSLGLAMLSLLLVFLIGRFWKDRRVGLWAGLFLAGQPFFFQKAMEIRPDGLALPFFLGSLWFLLRGLARSKNSTRIGLGYFLGGGFCIGAAIMCTQKMLFVLPGAFAGLGIWALSVGLHATQPGLRARILLILTFLMGIGIPVTWTWAAFAFHHAGREFIVNNFLLNAQWKVIVREDFLNLIETSWPVLALSLLGASVSLHHFFRTKGRWPGGFLLLCILVGLFAGVLVIPVAYKQYYLMPLPIACLFAAQGLIFLVQRARRRARPWLLILVTVSLSAYPVLALRKSSWPRNDLQLAKLRYVLESTKPTDLVMDGWVGMGVFRPHAFYYYFVHQEIVPMLSQEKVDAFQSNLERGKIRPRLIVMDANLNSLGSRFWRLVHRNYQSRDGLLFFSRHALPERWIQRIPPTTGFR